METFLGARKSRDAPIDAIQIEYLGACGRNQIPNFNGKKLVSVNSNPGCCLYMYNHCNTRKDPTFLYQIKVRNKKWLTSPYHLGRHPQYIVCENPQPKEYMITKLRNGGSKDLAV